VLVLAACRPPSSVTKQPAFDFAAHPTPTPADFSTEATLLSRWNDAGPENLKVFWNSGEAGTFKGVDGIDIAYRIHRVSNPKGGVVVVPGRTEAIIKFAEVVRDLVRQGYSTYAVTLRGQGEAQRILSDHDKGYVVWFDDYVADTHQFITQKVRPEQTKVFVLAHSTGGGVLANLIDQHPEDVDALATTSPMMQINEGAFPPPIAGSLAAAACGATDGTGYTIGAGPYVKETDFPANTVTGSQARFDWKIQQLTDDPTIQLGGVTWHWLCQALVGSSHGAQLGRYSSTPTLVFEAEKDTIVKLEGEKKYCDDAPRCTLVLEAGAKHELLQETDAIRNDVMAKVVQFFDAQVTP
jgi:lysophospholipase